MVFMISASLILLSVAFSQTTRQPKPKPVTSSETKRPARQRIRLGDDIEAIIRKLMTAGAGNDKGEFETKDEYKARRARTTPPTEFVLVLGDAAAFAYDADQGQMKIEVTSGGKAFSIDSKPCRAIEAKTIVTRRSQYIGKNAYGVSRVILSSENNEFGICVVHSSPMVFGAGEGPVTTKFTFPIDRHDAKAVKSFYRFALVGKVAEGWIEKGVYNFSPTVSEPYDVTTMYYYVPFNVTDTRVIDSRNGDVVTHFAPEHKVP